MAAKDFLTKYQKKRDFNISEEPFGESKNVKNKDRQIFVIQKHDARNLHYDFRLSVNGVLISWAIPKGPSTDPKVNRLAIHTEDHPLEYADFEGIIPEGQYGGGTVMVWDAGTYESVKKDEKGKLVPMDEQINYGHATFILNGKKLQGAYTLIRTEEGKNEKWLFKKINDEKADARRNPTSTENKSVLTNRTLDEIKKESLAETIQAE